VAFHVTWDDPSQDPPAMPVGGAPAYPATDVAAGRQAGAQTPTDALALVLKPDGARGDIVTLSAWPYEGSPTLDFCYWAAGNGRAYEMLSEDFERVIAHRGTAESLTSEAVYEDGRWHLVLQRPLVPAHPPGASTITPEVFTSVGLVVWDGANVGARAVSPWIDVVRKSNEQHP